MPHKMDWPFMVPPNVPRFLLAHGQRWNHHPADLLPGTVFNVRPWG